MTDVLKPYLASACEIKTMENDLLLHGRIGNVLDEHECTVDIFPLNDELLPPGRYDTPVKIHIFNTTLGARILGGRVYIANENFWRISQVKEYSNCERRGFFRVSVKTNAKVLQANEKAEQEDSVPSFSAKLLSISLSGVMFVTDAVFFRGETLILSDFCLGEEILPFNVACRVMRIGEQTSYGTQYGCAFEQQDQRESDRLCRVIFTLQREEIQRRNRRL